MADNEYNTQLFHNMKTFAFLLLGVALASAIPLEENFTDELAGDGWFVPQLDGSFKWTSEEEAQLEMRDLMRESRASAVVEFYLYTNSNPSSPQQIYADDPTGLSNSNFNKNHPTRFVIHGWQNNYLSDVNVDIRSALLSVGQYNVICVDWSDKAETLNYAASVLRVPGVGKKVAAMIDFLRIRGELSLDNLKVIGHSLGAHVSGFAGKSVTGGKIHAIIGLDPALPLYSYDKCSERLCSTDAFYVESIQTDGGMLGFLQPIGKAAFYPNGGKSQPGCGIDLAGSCAHSRSYIYYAEAIRKDDFPSMKCSDWERAVDKACGGTYSPTIKLGAPTNDNIANGAFYTPVNKKAPFGMG